MPRSEYWEGRYRKGGTSGKGSIGELRDWKWKIIEDNIGQPNDVIDVGCGDISFWEGRDCQKYIGIDISPTILRKNQEKRPKWRFIETSADAYQNISATHVFCFDVLFHIMDDVVFSKILSNIAIYSNEWIFIYTWKSNPLQEDQINKHQYCQQLREGKILTAIKSRKLSNIDSDGHYQRFRNFFDYIPIIESRGFKTISIEENNIDQYGAMFIFKK